MLEYEKDLLKKGYSLIAGMDEAGRGPLAGPVFASMCIMPLGENDIIDGIDDSKKLTPKKREELYIKIKEKAICYSVCSISEKEIDEVNILNATINCMKKCLEKISIKPNYILVDYVPKLELNVPFMAIKKGDALSYNIACASILAKVSRDRYMDDLDKKYPMYYFSKHKGYGTKCHYQMLQKYGVSDAHRKSFLKNLEEHYGG